MNPMLSFCNVLTPHVHGFDVCCDCQCLMYDKYCNGFIQQWCGKWGLAVLLSIIVVTNRKCSRMPQTPSTSCYSSNRCTKLPSISKSSMWANIPMFHSQSSVLSLHSGYHDDIVWTDMYPVSHGANAKYVWTLVPAVVGSAVCLVRWAPQGPVWNVRR